MHELAYLFHLQAGREFPRLWVIELFCNLCLHAYVARAEPVRPAALETFPAPVVAVGQRGLAHRTLEDLERLSVGLGPLNYAWYQPHLHAAAKRIFDQGDEDVVARAWELLPRVDKEASADELLAALERVHPEVARTLTAWPPK